MKKKLYEITNQVEYIDMAVVENALKRDSIRDWAYILHDKDTAEPHYHIAIRLKSNYDSKYVAEWFGVAEQYVGCVKGRWSDMLKYLIHENAPEKYQYSVEDVKSNFDWITEKDKGGDGRLNEILEGVSSGLIREYNYYEYIDDKEYVKYNRQIDKAFAYRRDKIKGVNREMEAVFITGDSGVGKTTYAKSIAEQKNYSIYVSSGTNDPFDDYKGEDCIILDDLRPSTLHLADLLKILDNNTASSVKSRYKNKVLECKLIIITTTLDIDTFFNNVFADEKETAVQLKRRCKYHVRMDQDYIYIKIWLDKSRSYGKEMKQVNPVTLEHKIKDMSEDEQMEKISEMFGLTKDLVDDYREHKSDYEQVSIETPYDEVDK